MSTTDTSTASMQPSDERQRGDFPAPVAGTEPAAGLFLEAYDVLGLKTLEENKKKIRAAIDRFEKLLGDDDRSDREQEDRVRRAVEHLSTPRLKTYLDAALVRRLALRAPPRSNQQAADQDICCGQCQSSNSGKRVFCTKCGGSLWQRCPECDADCTTDQTFCGECGINVPEGVRRQRAEADAVLARAERLAHAQDYAAAAESLEPLCESRNPRLDDAATRAYTLLREVENRRSLAEHRFAARIDLARELAAAGNYEEASGELSSIPAGMLPLDAEALLVECRNKQRELADLREELDTLLKGPRPLDALPVIRRLLSQQPNCEKAERTLGSLREKACRAALRLIKLHEYESAVALLEEIPDDRRDEDARKLLSHAREHAWLTTDIRRTPFVDWTLVELVSRLRRKAPDDARFKGLHERLARGCESLDNLDVLETRPPWVAPKSDSGLRFPVSWLAPRQALRAMRVSGDLEFDQRDRFPVAIGLALHGIEPQHLHLSLVKAKSSGVLSLLSSRSNKKPRSAWGIDVGSFAVKAVRLTRDAADGVITLDRVVEIPRGDAPTGSAESTGGLKQQLLELRERIPQEDDRLCFNLPGDRTIGRFLEMPEMNSRKLNGAIRLEARHQFPTRLEDLAWDHQVLKTLPPSGSVPVKQHRIAMVAAKKIFVDQFTAMLDEVKLPAWVVQPDCVALHNFVIGQLVAEGDGEATPPGHVALLDVGRYTSKLVISSADHFWFRTLGVGTGQVAAALVRELKLTNSQADRLIREPWRIKQIGRLYEAAEPVLRQLSDELRRSLDTFESVDPIARLWGAGGGFRFHGVARYVCRGR